MSVISAWGATPNRIEIVWAYLCRTRHNRMRETDLKARLAPPAHQRTDESQTVTDVITEMINLGLVARVEEFIQISENVPARSDALIEYLEINLLDPDKCETLRQDAFPFALSWFLSRDPAKPLDYAFNYNSEIVSNFGAESRAFQLTSPASFQQLINWATYFGFAWQIELTDPSRSLVFPDPTVALARHLPKIIGHQQTQPMDEAITRVGRELSVLDSGISRQEIERMLPVDKRSPANHISRSTSLALERLEDRNKIQLDTLDDAPNMVLDRASGQRPISHITWIQRV